MNKWKTAIIEEHKVACEDNKKIIEEICRATESGDKRVIRKAEEKAVKVFRRSQLITALCEMDGLL